MECFEKGKHFRSGLLVEYEGIRYLFVSHNIKAESKGGQQHLDKEDE